MIVSNYTIAIETGLIQITTVCAAFRFSEICYYTLPRKRSLISLQHFAG